MPTYTAIVTAYNAGDLVQYAIKSALAQTHPPMEILVVDDGSSDNTAEVVRRFPVQYIHRSNGGPAAARNTGLKYARGEWIAFLDHDDTWLPEKSAMQLERVSPDIDAIFCEKACDSENVPFAKMFERNYGGNPSGMMIRQSVLQSLNGFDEDPLLIGVEDYNLWLRFMLAGHRYRTTPMCYRCTPAMDHLSGKPDRMLQGELLNIDKVGALAGLDPAVVERRKQRLRQRYVPAMICDRKQKHARAHVFKAGFDTRDLLKYTVACYSPTWALDLRRRLISKSPGASR